VLPAEAPSSWQNVLSRTEITTQSRKNESIVLANDLFRHFPLAFLHA